MTSVPSPPVSHRQTRLIGADLRVAQHRPGHRGQDRRDEERQRDQHFQHAARPACRCAPRSRRAGPPAPATSTVLTSEMPTVLSSTCRFSARRASGVAVEIERRRPCRAASNAGCHRAASPSDRASGSRERRSAARSRPAGRSVRSRAETRPARCSRGTATVIERAIRTGFPFLPAQARGGAPKGRRGHGPHRCCCHADRDMSRCSP